MYIKNKSKKSDPNHQINPKINIIFISRILKIHEIKTESYPPQNIS